ncbi:hypothetical protein GSI_11071 [Ganoderma sinense ZZ0214-1]|uniref:Uncharacterized protein n=1 Tax=Ganoderma sinense ZZ0214-1 TaxID=1077348 RepID=A0A2G8RZ67_9APHY|nr:hypothetical protein GSI_11071 [Ganoderma sinense ZZ0214-1]
MESPESVARTYLPAGRYDYTQLAVAPDARAVALESEDGNDGDGDGSGGGEPSVGPWDAKRIRPSWSVGSRKECQGPEIAGAA